MMHHGSSRVTLVNADIAGGRGSLRLAGSRIASVSAAARPGDLVCAGDAVVDLHGDRVLPGLVNAHDPVYHGVYRRVAGGDTGGA